jgi:hypothetical protein
LFGERCIFLSVFCLVRSQLLPTADYAVGATLPAHLSPFVEEGEGDYVPPERQELLAKIQGIHQVCRRPLTRISFSF